MKATCKTFSQMINIFSFIISLIIFPIRVYSHEGLYVIGKLSTPFDQTKAAAAVPRVIIGSNSIGTAFFISADGHFLTNWHLFKHCIESYEKQGNFDYLKGYQMKGNPLECENIVLQMNDPEMTIIKKKITILALPAQDPKWLEEGKPLPVPRDYVLAKVDFKPQHWLNIAKNSPKIGDHIYAIGYPGNTMRNPPRDNPYQNADGTLRISSGLVTDIMENPGQNEGWTVVDQMFLSDVDSCKGSSGAPTLNEDGEVVGILFAGGMKGKICTFEHTGPNILHINIRDAIKALNAQYYLNASIGLNKEDALHNTALQFQEVLLALENTTQREMCNK